MSRKSCILFTLFSVFLSAFAGTALAAGDPAEIARMRITQQEIIVARDELRARADALQAQLDAGRTLLVSVPLEGIGACDTVTRQEADGVWRLDYLLGLIRNQQPFSSAGMEGFVASRAAAAPDIAPNFVQTIALLRDTADKLDAEWHRIEAQIAELSKPPQPTPPPVSAPAPQPAPSATPAPAPGAAPAQDDRVCLTLVGVETQFLLGDTAYLKIGAEFHGVEYRGDFNGRPVDASLTWRAPPQVICAGDAVDIQMTAYNKQPTAPSNITYPISAGVATSYESDWLRACSNPRPKENENYAAIDYDEIRHDNACLFEVSDTLPAYDKPRSIFSVNLSIATQIGRVTYLYQAQ